MPRYRLSDPAKTDIAAVLRASETIHGAEAGIRYRALLTAAMRRVIRHLGGRNGGSRSALRTFIHFWANDDAEKLARNVRSALETTAIAGT